MDLEITKARDLMIRYQISLDKNLYAENHIYRVKKTAYLYLNS